MYASLSLSRSLAARACARLHCVRDERVRSPRGSPRARTGIESKPAATDISASAAVFFSSFSKSRPVSRPVTAKPSVRVVQPLVATTKRASISSTLSNGENKRTTIPTRDSPLRFLSPLSIMQYRRDKLSLRTAHAPTRKTRENRSLALLLRTPYVGEGDRFIARLNSISPLTAVSRDETVDL